MGLDASIYLEVEETQDKENSDFIAYVIHESWKWKIKNLKDHGHYMGSHFGYACNYSYGTHRTFRDHLTAIAQGKSEPVDFLTAEPETIFYDLTDFADNEGCLDWEVCQKLYQEFEEQKQNAKNYFEKQEDGDWWYSVYVKWMESFKNAGKHNGVIVFM